MQEKIKFPYAIKVLEEKLRLEEIQLKKWENNVIITYDKDNNKIVVDKYPEQKPIHINGLNHRINELKQCIESLNIFVKQI